MKFATGLAAVALTIAAFASPVTRDVKSVQAGIMACSDQADALNSAVAVFKGSPSQTNMVSVTNELSSLVATIAAAIESVINSVAFTAAQSTNKIIPSLTAFASSIDTALTSLKTQRGNFNAFPPSIATIEASLLFLQSNLTSFENGLSAKIAQKSVEPLDDVSDSINNVVTPTVNAYSAMMRKHQNKVAGKHASFDRLETKVAAVRTPDDFE